MGNKMTNGDMPAMPIKDINGQFLNFANNYDRGWFDQEGAMMTIGMTKLEEFTKAAMVAILSNPSMIDQCDDSSLDWIAESALKMAKLQLKALEANNG